MVQYMDECETSLLEKIMMKSKRRNIVMSLRKSIFIYIVSLLIPLCSTAQEYNGLTGLLHVPSAETDSAGTFRGGVMFLHQEFLPAQMPRKNTFNYGIGLTGFRWIEASYCASLLWMHKNNDKDAKMGFYNEDRRVNVKITPLYEGRWWPGIALGWDDIGRWDRMKDGKNRNNYFQNIYIVGTKRFNIRGNELGAHLAYRYYPSNKNKDRRGVAGGVTFRPAFYPPLRLIAEWDGVGVNVGADALLWRHLFIQAALIHGRGFTGGLSYHYTIKF